MLKNKGSKAKDTELDNSISPVGWYVASILIRFEWYNEDTNNLNRRCLAWENQIIVKADNPEHAYTKAMEYGKQEESEAWDANNKERKGRWKFEGLTSLLAIYEELEDGAEIMWTEYKNRSIKKIKSRVKSKRELEVFASD
jgi:hypothetical protein